MELEQFEDWYLKDYPFGDSYRYRCWLASFFLGHAHVLKDRAASGYFTNPETEKFYIYYSLLYTLGIISPEIYLNARQDHRNRKRGLIREIKSGY